MASELEKLARSVRQVADTAGPHHTAIHQAKTSAHRLSKLIPLDERGSAVAAAAALDEAKKHAAEAADALEEFAAKAHAFAEGLARGVSGDSGGSIAAKGHASSSTDCLAEARNTGRMVGAVANALGHTDAMRLVLSQVFSKATSIDSEYISITLDQIEAFLDDGGPVALRHGSDVVVDGAKALLGRLR